MSTEQTRDRPSGAVADVKDKGTELVASAQEQVSAKAQELGGETSFQIRQQLDQRSSEAGRQAQSIGKALRSSANQLRSEGKDLPAKVVEEVARRADEVGGYLQSAQSNQILGDVERLVRSRPWLAAGTGVVVGFLASRFLKASGDRRYQGNGDNGHHAYSAPRQPALTSGGV
jgi:ElaB/YqjD/DUF883 family membrane-anchored ribosome-binding protein